MTILCFLAFQETETLRIKDREASDVVLDLKSTVAILSSDKEKLTQQKSDLEKNLDMVTLANNQLTEVILMPTLSIKIYLYALRHM